MARRLGLLDALDKAYAHGFVLTYEFQADFFERYCLEELAAFEQCRNLNVLVDGRVYDRLVSGCHSSTPRRANVRYLLQPVRVPGAFHPKLYLFASRDRGLLVVGSANLTRPGLCSNAELATVLRYEAGKQEQHLALFAQARDFVSSVVATWPSRDLEGQWADLLGEASWLAIADPSPSGDLRLLHNLDGPLWAQLTEGVDTPVQEVHVLSPFFDETPALLDHAIDMLRPRKITLWTENDRTTMTRAWEERAAIVGNWTKIRFGRWESDGHRQALHGKAMALRHAGGWRIVSGSANFTTRGLRSTALSGNVELVLMLDGVAAGGFRATSFFDPDGTSKEEALRPGVRSPMEVVPARPILLEEATLEEETLRCRATLRSPAEAGRWEARLELGEGETSSVPLSASGGRLSGPVQADVRRRCAEQSCVVRVAATLSTGERIDSNPVLLLNLQDVDTGESVRRHRRVRDAQRSAAAFAERYDELVSAGDDEEIRRFLVHVDIPLVNAPRLALFHGPRFSAGRPEALAAAGYRTIKACLTLHAAAVDFCERHLGRLDRHLRRPTLDGFPNFLHIARCVGKILSDQVDRLLGGCETLAAPLDAETWAAMRGSLNSYLQLFERTLNAVSDCVEQLSARYGVPRTREEMLPDIPALHDAHHRVREIGNRFDRSRGRTLRVRTVRGTVVDPFVSEIDGLSPRRWSGYVAHLDETSGRWMSWSAPAGTQPAAGT